MPDIDCPNCRSEHQPREPVSLAADCPACGRSFRVTEDGAGDEPVVRGHTDTGPVVVVNRPPGRVFARRDAVPARGRPR